MSDGDWRASIQPLRAWMDAGTLYLWVDRAPGDWRAIANPARTFDASIRKVARETWGREPTAIRYVDTPPDREQMINERRGPEHRQKLRKQEEKQHRRLVELAKEECLRLLEDHDSVLLAGSDAEKQRTLSAIIMDRAKRRLEGGKQTSGVALPASPSKRCPASDRDAIDRALPRAATRL